MTRERFDLINQLVEAALQLPAPQRAAWLDGECGTDAALRSETGRYLAAESAADPGEQLAASMAAVLTAIDPDDGVGPYRLLEELGRGGMGVVYRASRDHAGTSVEYALKILDPADVAESASLAALEHPFIAKLYAAGTDDFEPYMVMELVNGQHIDHYCASRKLPVRERVALMLQVAEALVFTHAHLLIHRDLKPSNIMVSESGVPKILDFGIARVLRGDAALEPGRGWSPSHASPEQARGAPVGTATDVYSFGMVLCEVLCGARPYETPAGSREEKIVFIERAPPSAPSSLAQSPRLQRQLSGELDAIVAKAIAKEPAARYRSMAELAHDLRAWLDGCPVSAYQGGTFYRMRKALRRNPAGAAALLLLLVGMAFAAVPLIRTVRRTAILVNQVGDTAEADDFRELLGVVEAALDRELAGPAGSPTAIALDQSWSKYQETLPLGLAAEAPGNERLRLAEDFWKWGELQRHTGNWEAARSTYGLARRMAENELPSSGWTRVSVNALARFHLIPGRWAEPLSRAHEILGDVHARASERKSAGDEYRAALRFSGNAARQAALRVKLAAVGLQ